MTYLIANILFFSFIASLFFSNDCDCSGNNSGSNDNEFYWEKDGENDPTVYCFD